MSKHESWLNICEKNGRKTCLLERYVDDKNVVSIYEFNNNIHNRVYYCIWDNERMSVFSDYALALFVYANITDKYIKRMFTKGKGSYTERKVIR